MNYLSFIPEDVLLNHLFKFEELNKKIEKLETENKTMKLALKYNGGYGYCYFCNKFFAGPGTRRCGCDRIVCINCSENCSWCDNRICKDCTSTCHICKSKICGDECYKHLCGGFCNCQAAKIIEFDKYGYCFFCRRIKKD